LFNFKLIGNIFLFLFVIFTKNTYSQVNLSPEGPSVKNNILKKHSNQYICDNAVAQITDNWEWRKTSLFKPFVDEAYRRGLSCGIQSNKQIEIKNIKSNNKNNIKKHTNLKSVNSQVNKNISSLKYTCSNMSFLAECKSYAKDRKECKNPEKYEKMSGLLDFTLITEGTISEKYLSLFGTAKDILYGRIEKSHIEWASGNPYYYPYKSELIIHSWNGENKNNKIFSGSTLNVWSKHDGVKQGIDIKYIYQKEDIQITADVSDGFLNQTNGYFRVRKKGAKIREDIFHISVRCKRIGINLVPKKSSNTKDADKLFK
jgi:hypothetical protein